MANILITEVNSNATGGDFFELYNHGSTDIDLSGWQWNDSQAMFGGSSAVTFASGTTLAAGQVLLVFTGAASAVATFKSAWGLDSATAVYANASAGPGLGKGDAVVLFDASGNVAAALNYNDTATAANGISSATRTDGSAIATTDNHAGPAMGGSADGVSAVWDQTSSTNAPKYTFAAVGSNGGYAHASGASSGVGSPGAPLTPTLRYSSKTLNESLSNDGSISSSITLTLSNETLTGSNGDDLIAAGKAGVLNLPDGLTAVLTRTSATSASLTLTGNASAHDNANDVSNLTVALGDSAFASGNSEAVSGAITSNVVIDFIEPSLVYSSTVLNEASAFDGAVNGKIVITLVGGSGSFAGSNGDSLLSGDTSVGNVPAGLTAHLVRTSATTAELSFTGNATSHANANDLSNLSISFGDSALVGISAAGVANATRADLQVNFAELGIHRSEQTFTPNPGTSSGSSDTSTAVALDANWMIVADNEGNVLRVYARAGGDAVAEWSYASISPLLSAQADIEGSFRIGDTLYFTGSHSNKSGGDEADNREILFAVNISGTGASTQFSLVNSTMALEAAFVAWDSSNAHGLGANHFGFAIGSADGVPSEVIHGFNIEGLTASADGSMLMFGMRAPLVGTEEKAVIFTVQTSSVFSGAPVFGTPIELDLDGRGIREIKLASDGSGYLIVAGPAASESAEVTHDFRLYRWDGSGQPVELDTELDSLLAASGGSFETIVDVQSTASGTLVQLLQDNGDTVWSGQTAVSKDLSPSQQKYLGNWVQLGDAVTDSSGPVLASSSPADNAVGVQAEAHLVLRFDEGVMAGSGSFVIKNTADGSVVETIAANSSQVTVDYNTVTIKLTSELSSGASYDLQTTGQAVVDHNGNAWGGLVDAAALNFTVASPTSLDVGDIVFLAANGDSVDAFAFLLMKPIEAGTGIFFSDRDSLTASNESAFQWVADQSYAAGTVVTIQTDPLVTDKGGLVGASGGISTSSETIFAFQGSVADLATGTAGNLTVDRYVAAINVGGAAGPLDATLKTVLDPVNAYTMLAFDNAKYTGWLDTTDLTALRSLIANTAHWSTSDTLSFALTGGSLFPSAPAPVLTAASADGTSVELTFSEPLDAVNMPLPGAFGIHINGAAAVAPTAIHIVGNQLTLTLGTELRMGQTVSIDYADTTPSRDDVGALQDAAGNDAASFSGVAVTNNTPNAEPSGSVILSGTAAVGKTLTATHTLADADGLGTVTYQWLRDDEDISGATGSTYTLSQNDLKAFISVRASYIDGAGTAEAQLSLSEEVTGYAFTTVENAKTVGTVAPIDSLLGKTPKYSLSGADAALFKISSKGVITFAQAPDFENPADADFDDVYSFDVTQTNSKTGYAVTQTIWVDVAFAAIEGTSAGEKLRGTKGSDTLDGKAGNDTLTGSDGLDTFIISAGSDTITDFNVVVKNTEVFAYEVLQVAEGASVSATVKTDWMADSDSFNLGEATLVTSGKNIDLSAITSGHGWNVINKGKAIVLTGSQFDDVLRCGNSDDIVIGGAGNDTLIGGRGYDYLVGGEGADTFRLGSSTKDDILEDFVSGEDRLELDNAVFKVLSDGALLETQFGLGTAATTASQRLVYDGDTGRLWYDADGTGRTKAVLIGVLDNKADLLWSDVLVV